MVNPPGSSSGGSSRLQQTLQAVVQSVQWTYSLFWQLCPQQGILVWGDGYYNGAIKTRKTVQPMEVSTEEASLQRSQQLRELYESLSSGEANLLTRRPCAALSPEDLTEAEWFYLMCISFSFPPGVGLPGKAFAKQRHVWLTKANEVDSKVFSRAILAKSAQIQTVVCIPLADGVLELGNTEKVEEDVALIQHAKKFFKDYNVDPHTKPALSEHSTSDPFASSADQQQLLFQQPPQLMMLQMNIDTHASNHYQEEEEDDEEEDDQGRISSDVNDQFDEDDDEGDDQVIVDGSCRQMRYTSVDIAMEPNLQAVEEEGINPAAEACELMQLEMSEDVRIGSISDCSNNLNVEQMPSHYDGSQSKHQRHEQYDYKNWQFLLQDIGNVIQPSLGSQLQDFSPEDAHYSETVTSIMRNNMKRWVESSSFSYFVHKEQESAFTKWTNVKRDQHLMLPSQATSQWLLKNVLVKIGEFHCKFNDGSSPNLREIDGGNKFQKSIAQEEISANHVLAERRRREKLNERFMVLRSLVPFVTKILSFDRSLDTLKFKMDKASILGDTIEYVKQLRRRIQDLEAKNRQIESDWKSKSFDVERMNQYSKLPQKSSCSNYVGSYRTQQQKRACVSASDKRAASRSQVLGTSSADGASAAVSGGRMREAASAATSVQVSMIDSDALLEIRCSNRDGVLLQILHALQDLGLEFTSIQFSSTDDVFSAEIRSKVKEVHGKRVGIVDVKKAIHQIVL